MINFLIQIVAYILIYTACEIGRKPDSKISPFSRNGAIQIVLVTLGGILLQHFYK